ncbi:hypothetical protein IJ750_00510 [bacterium]|nr:hypothetical protein [bacterium]
MSKISKIDLNLGQKIVNPFKTARSSVTNPFKYSNFEGNTLQFADVFEGFEPKKVSKLKMITSSVMGSITKLHNSITEPIIHFVNRIKGGISSAWDYAKNTNVTEYGTFKPLTDCIGSATECISNIMNTDIVDIGKGISHVMNTDIVDIGRGINSSIAGVGSSITHSIGKGVSESISILNTDITDIGKGLSGKWSSLIGKIHTNRITKDTSVSELKAMWESEIASTGKEVA